MNHSDLPLHLGAALSALAEAIPGTGSEDHQQALAAAGTSLFWACALDEQFELTEGYKSRRNQHPVGRLLLGLRAGRNAVAHGAAVVVMPITGRTWPAVWPLVWTGATWAEYDIIAAGLSKAPSHVIRTSWEIDIAGQNVTATLTAVHQWLSEEAIRPSSTTSSAALATPSNHQTD